MNCCRSILNQISALDRINGSLSHGSLRERAYAVEQSLDTFRTVLSSHRLDNTLTQTFRQDLEPAAANVWTATDLVQYTDRVSSFKHTLRAELEKWSQRYCNKRACALPA